MNRVVLLLAPLALIFGSCGYDGHYRYECQDPANWKDEYCNPPFCRVEGACTEDLIGFDPDAPQEDTP